MTDRERGMERATDREHPSEGERGGVSAAGMLREFHAEADHPATNDLWLRPTLHREESQELIEALVAWGHEVSQSCEPESADALALKKAVARELADVVYVAYGTALLSGIDLDIALREVHRANMQKVREGVRRRDDGKIVKGPNFKPPDLTAAIRKADHA